MESGQVVLSGMMSGVIQTIVGFPLDTLTVWKQNKRTTIFLAGILIHPLLKPKKFAISLHPVMTVFPCLRCQSDNDHGKCDITFLKNDGPCRLDQQLKLKIWSTLNGKPSGLVLLKQGFVWGKSY